MELTRNPAQGRLQQPILRSAFLAVIAVAAMLVGLIAMHSMDTEHADRVMLPIASAQAAPVSVMPGVAAVAVAAVSVMAHTNLGTLDCAGYMLDCALLAMTCAVLLILASLVLLARLPSSYHRLLDAGGHVVHLFRGPVLDIYRPSLTVLSISRT